MNKDMSFPQNKFVEAFKTATKTRCKTICTDFLSHTVPQWKWQKWKSPDELG